MPDKLEGKMKRFYGFIGAHKWGDIVFLITLIALIVWGLSRA